MKIGDLVKWTLSWCVTRNGSGFDDVDYRGQIGILERKWDLGWYVAWSDGQTRRVHKDYLEAI